MAVSPDLRQRAVNAYERREGSLAAIYKRFAVGRASLSRWVKRKRDTGSVERAPRAGGNPRRITPEGEALLSAWLADNPSTAQHVLAGRLVGAGQRAVCQQTVGATLARMALTHRKSPSEPYSDSATTS